MHRLAATVDWLVFLALGLAWGSSYLFIKIGVETLAPLVVVAGRLAIGAAVLAGVMLARRQPLPRQAGVYGRLVIMALLGIVIPFSLISWGEQTIDSGLAAILNGSVPLFAILLAALVLVDEPITVNRLVGLLVGFAGVVVITAPSLRSGLGGGVPGEVALIGASVSYAAAGVYGRHALRDVPALTNAFFEVGFAFVLTLVIAVVLGTPLPAQIEPSAMLAVAWLGLVGSGLAFLAFFFLLGRWGATRTSLVAYLLPVVGIVLGVVVRGEQMSIAVALGTVLVIGGVALVNSRRGSRRLFGRREPEIGGPAAVRAEESRG
jgi:drug/metabolite transporter (DMT)-like permease